MSVPLRQRVDQALTTRVDQWIHPLTQVVLTSLLEVIEDGFVAIAFVVA